MEKGQVWKEIDAIGGFLSVSGIVLLYVLGFYRLYYLLISFYSLVGLQFGGNDFPWKSAQVIAPMVIGLILFILFVIWEWKGAKYPMVPGGMFEGQRITGSALAVAFIIGMDVYAILNFLPLAFGTLYSPDPLQIGLKSLGFGFGQTSGGIIGNVLMTLLPYHHKEILLFSSVLMGEEISLFSFTCA